ncbi:ricin B lectin domain-containing protein [Cunninghamella echinulata]|nr:ricin B lectin domain-containing protein [Cunninghamella echinulata]
MFPQGYFYILSCKHGFALDVQDGSTKEDSNIIVWPQKFEDSDNQLWSYVNGRLINKKSNHAVDIRSSAFKKDKVIVQNKQKDKNQSQYWSFDQGFICSQEYPSMVFDIKGDSEKGGAQVLLYKRKESDNLNQKWYIEPYHDIEASLNLAVKDVQLNKKEGFGLPQPGYAAQPGAPPELKSVPVNNSIAGVGYGQPSSSASLTTPTPTTSGPTAESHNNYGGPTPPPKDYGTSQFAPPTHSVSSSSLYSNPPPPSDAYPPPPPPSDAYPPPQSTPYPPPQPNAYPPPQSNAYPPPQSNPYPPPNNNSYPPSSNNNSYPPPPSDYPPYSQQQQQQSIPVGSPGGYPPQSSQDATPGVGGFFLPPPNSPPPSQMPGMPSSQMNYPPPANNHGYYPPPPQ